MTSLATNVWASEGASLVGQSSPLQELLYDLSEELEEISDEISNTIKLVEEVNEAMSYASYRLASYEIRKENQIEVMHSQIKLIYEMGSGSLMEVLLYADSITEFLNAMEMIQAVTEHNRSMILELQETHDSIEKYKKEIEEREAELAATLERLGVQQERLEREAEEVAADLTNFNIKLSVIQGDISEADRLLNELNIDTRTMEITYEARLLAAIIHTEARGEPFVGQIAVGNVVLNRVNNHQFPDTIEEVIRQPGQFCPVREGTFDFVLSNGGYHQELRAALYVLNGQATVTSDMLFFNSLGFGTVRIANHWFRALA
jgi:predicted  nucleic acid-binding Zn-ribbon protein